MCNKVCNNRVTIPLQFVTKCNKGNNPPRDCYTKCYTLKPFVYQT